MSTFLWLAVYGCVVAAAGTKCVEEYAKRRLLDLPNDRSLHSVPTPRGGGLAIVIVFLVGMAYLWLMGAVGTGEFWALLIGGVAIATVGFWDDHKPLSAGQRFLVHSAAAALAVALIGGVRILDLAGFHLELGWAGRVAAVVCLLWAINLYNFMDGIDGLAASEAVYACLSIAALAAAFASGRRYDLVLLGAACAGFLVLNWPPARIFMGDVGSGFLGFAIGACALEQAQVSPEWVWVGVIVPSLFIADATVTLVRRMARGERWSQPHRTHAYQWLAQKHSHRAVTLGYMAVNVVVLLPAACAALRWPVFAAPIALTCLAVLSVAALKCGAGDPAPQPSVR